MDCGPAALKCLLEGHGIAASYGRLREACQTDVDGTSIDALEEVTAQLGLAAEQIMLPADHLLLPEARAGPALVVVRLANGLTHFVVVWRQHGPFVQVMDPGQGRRWLTQQQLLDRLYIHTFPVPAAAWRQWAGSDEFLAPLARRLRVLGGIAIEPQLSVALADQSWRGLARLDAATRVVTALVESGAIRRGAEAGRTLSHLLAQAGPRVHGDAIPDAYWFVRPAGEDETQLILQGALLVRVSGRQETTPAGAQPLSPELAAALAEAPVRPLPALLRLLRDPGAKGSGSGSLLAPVALIPMLFLVAAGVLIEAVLLRSLLDAGRALPLPAQRANDIAMVLLFVFALLLLQLLTTAGSLRLGRQIETRLRIAFFKKLPRLHDRYFQSRLVSDMAERIHSVHRLRTLPLLGQQFLHAAFELLFTTAGIIWLAPAAAPIAVLAAVVAAGLPLAAQTVLAEQEMRARTHLGGLNRFYLDAMLGLAPIRTHGAEPAVRHEHEALLVEWVRASLDLLRTVLAVEAIQRLAGVALAAWLLFRYLASGGSNVLLLVYWTLSLPLLGQELAAVAQRYPQLRSVTLRLLEPLSAPETDGLAVDDEQPRPPVRLPTGVGIEMEGVAVRAAGHTLLQDVNLNIAPGSHVAIVGPSGAGKSTLVGLLLGWHRPAAGCLRLDGRSLDTAELTALRAVTAWIDPAVQLWNRSLLDNLHYGANCPPLLDEVLAQAELHSVLERLPGGLQTILGEGGGLLSGGEGQRVRLARAMMRPHARLVILDEPFRGLDREQRCRLLHRARRFWRGATFLCVTHDVAETRTFDHVLVVEDGWIVENGSPAELAACTDGRYRAMLDADADVRQGLWGGSNWCHWWLADGVLQTNGQDTGEDAP
jgi:ATP-binding cassette subfamily B protein